MSTASNAARFEKLSVNTSCLRKSTRVIDDAVIGVDGIIAAIQVELEGANELEFTTVRQLLTSATQLLELAQDELDRVYAELNPRGEDELDP